MKRIPILLLVLMVAAWSLEAVAQPADVNLLQDCWTTSLDQDDNPERELYSFTTDDPITFVWKHKILENCTSYLFSIYTFQCIEGKPPISPVAFRIANQQLGSIEADPAFPEPLFSYTAPPGSIPPGSYDWALLVECDDTDGTIIGVSFKDGDIDDECGINVGQNPATGLVPVIFGPEPLEVLDPDPGGVPPGRLPGEEGTTRPWCFDVEESLPESCAPQSCGTFTPCEGGSCFCFELFDAPGTGGCIDDAACGTNCSANGDADCAGGEVCITNTCCGYPSCAPASCSAGLISNPLGLPTASGLNRGFNRK